MLCTSSTRQICIHNVVTFLSSLSLYTLCSVLQVTVVLHYFLNSAILNFRIISRRFSASLLISSLEAAHSSAVAEFVCTTSLICSIPSLICWISDVCVSNVSAILVTSSVIVLELSATAVLQSVLRSPYLFLRLLQRIQSMQMIPLQPVHSDLPVHLPD